MGIANHEVPGESDDAFPDVQVPEIRVLEYDYVAYSQVAAEAVPFGEYVVFCGDAEGWVHGGADGGLRGYSNQSQRIDDQGGGVGACGGLRGKISCSSGTYRPVIDMFLVEPCAAEAPGEESESFEGADAYYSEL